jgi:hypothetical protein
MPLSRPALHGPTIVMADDPRVSRGGIPRRASSEGREIPLPVYLAHRGSADIAQ